MCVFGVYIQVSLRGFLGGVQDMESFKHFLNSY